MVLIAGYEGCMLSLLSEAVKVRDELFPEMDIEYLFAQSDNAS